jgi:hypothetical protein
MTDGAIATAVFTTADWPSPPLAVTVAGAPPVTVTPAVCVMPVAEIVFASASVDVKVAVNTPLPFVVPDADGLNALFDPVDESVTPTPVNTAFPN